MSFLYTFINLFQPGILWPDLAALRPMLLMSILAAITGIAHRAGAADLLASYFKHPAFRWFLVYVVVQIISVYYSGFGSMLNEFNAWYIYPLFLAISFLLMRDEKTLRQYVWGTLAGGAIVVGWGLWQWFVRPPEMHDKPAGAYGLYANHNDFTFIALTLLPYAWMLFVENRKFLPRVFCGLVALGSMGAVVVSLSRGGILVLALEVAMLGWATTRGTQRAAMMTVLLLLAPVAILHQFSAREEGTTNDYTVETAKTSRYELWTAAGRMIMRHPFLGVGSRRFSEFSSEYNEISHDNKGKVAHNTYLEIAAGSGLLGISSYLLMLWNAVRPLTRTVRAGHDGMRREDSIAPVRTATFIGLVCIIVRALLDVKIFDSCVFTLIALSIATVALTQRQAAAAAQAAANQAGEPAAPALQEPGASKPRVRASSAIFPSARRM